MDMEYGGKCLERLVRRRVAVILVLSLVLGMLPARGASVSRAEEGQAGTPALSNPRVSDGITTWDCIYFGNYWQSDTNGDGKADQDDEKEAIKWRVLSVDGDDAFLLADRNLDCQPYSDKDGDVTWETSTLRTWLNDTFLKNAFSASEQTAIKSTEVVNSDNLAYGTEGGNDTTDQVYLLSINEVSNASYGFSTSDGEAVSRRVLNTAYAKERGASANIQEDEYVGSGCWWLRSSGYNNICAANVNTNGSVKWFGNSVGDSSIAVRPALHVNLSSVSELLSAGTETADSTVAESATPPAASFTASLPPATNPPYADIHNPRVSDGITTWDCIYFGNYWQSDTNGDGKADQYDDKQPIKWRVLSIEGDDAFLLADQKLDCQPYNNTCKEVTWETSTLRTWLNDTFLNSAFSASEQAAIKSTQWKTAIILDDGTEGENDTTDQVYLLSKEEVTNENYGFSASDEKALNRSARDTAYAKEQREVLLSSSSSSINEDAMMGNGAWWLRSPGVTSSQAAYVDYDGEANGFGIKVSNGYVAVRPALHVNLSSVLEWSSAGTMASDKTVVVPSASPMAPSEQPTATPSASPFPTIDPSYAGLQNPRINGSVTTWDCIYFGNYWQNDTDGDGTADEDDEREPIKWRILSIDGEDAFLVADQNLDCQPYNDTSRKVTWETSTLRTWLNDTFLNKAFSTSEQAAIKNMAVINNDDPDDGTEEGTETTDKVYLLSGEEVVNRAYGFSTLGDKEAENRTALNTAYTKKKRAYTEYEGNGNWWLRSSAASTRASYVKYNGYVYQDSYSVTSENVAIRPALHLNLSYVSQWSKAGTVASNGEVVEPTPPPTVPPAVTPVPTKNPLYTDIKEPRVSGTVTTWDCVYFGNYWQNDTDGDGTADQDDEKEPIKWRVLSVVGDDMFLLADQSLDCQKYNDTYEKVTWETSTLRTWLNGSFFNDAFTVSERAAINGTKVINSDNPDKGTGGGKDTIDQVYLLSIEEVTNRAYGFSSSGDKEAQNREACNTAYTEKKGAYTTTGSRDERNGSWWLRSPGSYGNYSSYVRSDGYVNLSGSSVNTDTYAVRPALHLNLSAVSELRRAGTVASDGTVTEPTAPPTVPPSMTPVPTTNPMFADIQSPRVSDDVTTWSCIYFGNYWQNNPDEDDMEYEDDTAYEKQPIKWRVLSVVGDDAFLMADQNLDARYYHEMSEEVTWEESELREWLNDTFLNDAFSASEQMAIKSTSVINSDNPDDGTEGGNDTTDQVYLLSIAEAMDTSYGFLSDESRRAESTAYASARESYANWWLRSPGSNQYRAAYVEYDGHVVRYGDGVDNYVYAIRPVLHLDLSVVSELVRAGTVASDGTVTEPAPMPGETTAPMPGETLAPMPGESLEPMPEETSEPMPGEIEPPVSTVTPENPPSVGGNPFDFLFNPNTEIEDDDSGGKKKPASKKEVTPGMAVTISGLKYTVKKSTPKERTVVLRGVSNKKLKKANVPNTVKIQSASYKVVEVGKNAFKGCKNLTTATVGKEVLVIGKRAFGGCKKLKKVVIRSKKLKKIGKGAFAGVSRKAKIQVPKSKVSQYRKLMKKG